LDFSRIPLIQYLEKPELKNGVTDPSDEVGASSKIEKQDFLKAIEEIAERSKN